jgi:hypothetical protein
MQTYANAHKDRDNMLDKYEDEVTVNEQLLSKSTANVTIHPRAIAYFFLMLPFSLN